MLSYVNMAAIPIGCVPLSQVLLPLDSGSQPGRFAPGASGQCLEAVLNVRLGGSPSESWPRMLQNFLNAQDGPQTKNYPPQV